MKLTHYAFILEEGTTIKLPTSLTHQSHNLVTRKYIVSPKTWMLMKSWEDGRGDLIRLVSHQYFDKGHIKF